MRKKQAKAKPTRLFHVLTDVFLFRRIVAFQRGRPVDVMVAWTRRGKDSAFSYAIRTKDLRLLTRLYDFSQTVAFFHSRVSSEDWTLALRTGFIPILEWLAVVPTVSFWRNYNIDDVLSSASIPMIKWALGRHRSLRWSRWEMPLSFFTDGHLEVIKWVIENFRDIVPPASAMDTAATHGHLDLLQYLHEYSNVQYKCSRSALESAVRDGRWSIVTFMVNVQSVVDASQAIRIAATHRRRTLEEFLHTHCWTGCRYICPIFRDQCHASRINCAAAHGSIEGLRLMGSSVSNKHSRVAMSLAAQHGKLKAVKFLHANRFDSDYVRAMRVAARFGHLDVLTYLLQVEPESANGDLLCDAASWSMRLSWNQLDVVRYLHEHLHGHCTAAAFEKAAKKGHHSVVAYLAAECSAVDRTALVATVVAGAARLSNQAR